MDIGNNEDDFILRKCTSLERGIISTLLYFDIFRYPLTKDELLKFCHFKIKGQHLFEESLQHLIREKLINHSNGFYFVSEDHSIIDRRINGNLLAEKFMEKAKQYSKLIANFPFVKAVFISGSLSKGFMDKDADIDYFIITQKGRLWLCRTLLVLFKKIFLFNSHKHFCVNYFIDDETLVIPDMNMFTATEVVTLLPMYNPELCENFFNENNWTRVFIPNGNVYPKAAIKNNNNYSFRKFIEKILGGSAGSIIDEWCLTGTMKFWNKKFSHFSEDDFKNALRSRKNVSKHHPNKFQEKVLLLFKEKKKHFSAKFDVEFEEADGLVLTLFQ